MLPNRREVIDHLQLQWEVIFHVHNMTALYNGVNSVHRFHVHDMYTEFQIDGVAFQQVSGITPQCKPIFHRHFISIGKKMFKGNQAKPTMKLFILLR
jgi:hypothetical protein